MNKGLVSTACASMVVSLLFPFAVFAEIPFSVRQAVVVVACGDRQGSGVVVNGTQGYILTNAHVVEDVEHSVSPTPDPCEVGFITNNSGMPTIFYTATAEKYVYDASTNADFAILKLGNPEQQEQLTSIPFLKTDEFSQVGDPLSVLSYPASSQGEETITSGTIQYLAQGTLQTDTNISPGSSGGAGVDADNNLIGLATGILYEEVSPGVEKLIDYELVDIRAVLAWLDTFGPNTEDQYITHSDPVRYNGPQAYVIQQNLNCNLLAKTEDSPSVYCLKPDETRSVFPNSATYHVWFGDFSAVTTVSSDTLAQYTLSANITMRPGTLIKIESDPKVYLVTDTLGTIRQIPSEARARELFGDGWAGFVKDVPVTFFQNYSVSAPLP
jgi:hypothetical protein